jgi:hypothetical protein
MLHLQFRATFRGELIVLKFLPVGLVIFLLAGCGTNSSPKPTPTPKPTLTPTPTKAPAGFIPAGSIQFGDSVTGTKLHTISTRFAKSKPVAWVAHFSQPPGTKILTWTVTRTGGKGQHPATVTSTAVSVRANATYLGSSLKAQQLNSKKITFDAQYRMDYLKGNKVLATGQFLLSSGSGLAPSY